MMHVSGTGGAPKYGFIPQMPLTSVTPPVNVLDNMTYCQPRVRAVFCVLCLRYLAKPARQL